MKDGLTKVLVRQLFNNRGLLMTCSEFLSEYKMPVNPKEFAIVMGAINQESDVF